MIQKFPFVSRDYSGPLGPGVEPTVQAGWHVHVGTSCDGEGEVSPPLAKGLGSGHTEGCI